MRVCGDCKVELNTHNVEQKKYNVEHGFARYKMEKKSLQYQTFVIQNDEHGDPFQMLKYFYWKEKSLWLNSRD